MKQEMAFYFSAASFILYALILLFAFYRHVDRLKKGYEVRNFIGVLKWLFLFTLIYFFICEIILKDVLFHFF